jgi:hypothetical protein
MAVQSQFVETLSSMRTFAVLCAIAMITSCIGCSAVKLAQGIEPTRVWRIEKGEVREKVEEMLGAPIQITRTATGSLVYYQCDLGLARENLTTGQTQAANESADALGNTRCLAARNVIFSVMFFGAPEIYARERIARQKGIAVIGYDSQHLVQDVQVRCVKPPADPEPVLKIY